MPEHKKFLLHICCAPCACGCLEALREENMELVLYFSNSNLNSRAEFERRLAAACTLSAAENLALEVDPYDHEGWLAKTSAWADEPEGGRRCRQCFEWALARAAQAADALNCAQFATSLTVSPHKSSALIFEIGGIHPKFQPWNFKKRDGYLKGIRRAQALNLYRQNYCGCEFSLRDRMASVTTLRPTH